MIDFCAITPNHIAFDIETYPNIFTLTAVHCFTGEVWVFEISDRKNESAAMCDWLDRISDCNGSLIGFNSLAFDYPVVHYIYKNYNTITVKQIYNRSQDIIQCMNKFAFTVWESDWVVPQIDLFKLHHFDNPAKSTSLKVLEFNMLMRSIEDCPFDFGINLNDEQKKILLQYNLYDVKATIKFYHYSKEQLDFRQTLNETYNKNYLNHNDVKLGTDFFISRLEQRTPECCFQYVNGKRSIVQTKREQMVLKDIVLDYITFENLEFKRVLDFFKSQTITQTKDVFSGLKANVGGLDFAFGTGGLHSSVKNKIFKSTAETVIIDLDVTSYYPSLSIVNKFYPQHLGETFCEVYQELFNERKLWAKGTVQNEMLKLALNGSFGNTNSDYSPLKDPQFTMAITINGQLLLCLLAEALIRAQDVKLIQANTDGITFECLRTSVPYVEAVKDWWQNLTGLQLEQAEYSLMAIKDVNNYLAQDLKGNIKRKGVYASDRNNKKELPWHKNHGALVVPKAAEAWLVHGADIEDFICNHNNMFDFYLRERANGKSYVQWGGKKIGKTVRYYVAEGGKELEQVRPTNGTPGDYKRKNSITDEYYNEIKALVNGQWDERINTKNKSVYEEFKTSAVCSGYKVQICNDLDKEYTTPIDFSWYINETKKLTQMVD